MNFGLDDGIRNIQAMAHWFAETELRPIALQADREHRYPDATLLKMVEMGFQVRARPSKGGRKGGGDGQRASRANRLYVIGAEELAWGDASSLLCAPGPGLGGPPLRIMGTPEQQEKYFAVFKDKSTPHFGAYALTEPGCGTDAGNIQTTARKDGDDWIIYGTKCFITNGASADWVVVFATVDKSAGKAGHRAFVVEKGTPGFRVGKIEQKMGLRAAETAELRFEDVRVPAENLLGGEAYYEGKAKGGFVGAMKTFDTTRPAIGAAATGIARAAWEIARDYAQQNYMLARPVPRYRLLQAKLARMKRRIDAARLLCWRAAAMADQHVPNTREASVAKAFAGQMATEVCADALQITGATGSTQALLVEKCFRDVKVFDIFEGTAQAQRIVIAKRIIEGITTF